MWYRCFFLLLLLIFSFPISLRRLVDVHRVGRGLCWRSYIASCTTAAGLDVLDVHDVRGSFAAAVRAATQRSRELGT